MLLARTLLRSLVLLRRGLMLRRCVLLRRRLMFRCCLVLLVRRLHGRRLCLLHMARLIPVRLVMIRLILVHLIVCRLIVDRLVHVRRLRWIRMRLLIPMRLHYCLIMSLHSGRHMHVAIRGKRLANNQIRRAALIDAGELRAIGAGSVLVLQLRPHRRGMFFMTRH